MRYSWFIVGFCVSLTGAVADDHSPKKQVGEQGGGVSITPEEHAKNQEKRKQAEGKRAVGIDERPAALVLMQQSFASGEKPTLEELNGLKDAPLYCFMTPNWNGPRYQEVPAVFHSLNDKLPVVINDRMAYDDLANARSADYAFKGGQALLDSDRALYSSFASAGSITGDSPFTKADFLKDTEGAFRATYHYAPAEVRPITYVDPVYNVAVKSKVVDGRKEYFIKMQVDGGAGLVQIQGEEKVRPPVKIYVCSTQAPKRDAVNGRTFCRTIKEAFVLGAPPDEPTRDFEHCVSFENGSIIDNSDAAFGTAPLGVSYRMEGNKIIAHQGGGPVTTGVGEEVYTLKGNTIVSSTGAVLTEKKTGK